MAILFDSNQYKYSKRGPLDSKTLVKKYSDLLNRDAWLVESTMAAYNGMLVAVWANKDDTSKNGVYYLFDPSVTLATHEPDVTNPNNWRKIAELSDVENIKSQLGTISANLGSINASVESVSSKVNAFDSEIAALRTFVDEADDTYVKADSLDDVIADKVANKADMEALDALQTVVADTYATKDSIKGFATISDLGSVSAQFANVYTKDEVYTKAETRDYVEEAIQSINDANGESAADVLLALNNYKQSNDERVGKVETDLDAAKSSIGSINATIETLTTSINSNADSISALNNTVANLGNKDNELADLIQANTDKFEDYYTKADVEGLIDAIPEVNLDPYALTSEVDAKIAALNDSKVNVSDVYSKTDADSTFVKSVDVAGIIDTFIDQVNNDDNIKGIKNLVDYVNENAGEIADLVNDVNSLGEKVDGLAEKSDGYAARLTALENKTHAKPSDEISMADDGTLGIIGMDVSKLRQSAVLILDSGNAFGESVTE